MCISIHVRMEVSICSGHDIVIHSDNAFHCKIVYSIVKGGMQQDDAHWPVKSLHMVSIIVAAPSHREPLYAPTPNARPDFVLVSSSAHFIITHHNTNKQQQNLSFPVRQPPYSTAPDLLDTYKPQTATTPRHIQPPLAHPLGGEG